MKGTIPIFLNCLIVLQYKNNKFKAFYYIFFHQYPSLDKKRLQREKKIFPDDKSVLVQNIFYGKIEKVILFLAIQKNLTVCFCFVLFFSKSRDKYGA